MIHLMTIMLIIPIGNDFAPVAGDNDGAHVQDQQIMEL